MVGLPEGSVSVPCPVSDKLVLQPPDPALASHIRSTPLKMHEHSLSNVYSELCAPEEVSIAELRKKERKTRETKPLKEVVEDPEEAGPNLFEPIISPLSSLCDSAPEVQKPAAGKADDSRRSFQDEGLTRLSTLPVTRKETINFSFKEAARLDVMSEAGDELRHGAKEASIFTPSGRALAQEIAEAEASFVQGHRPPEDRLEEAEEGLKAEPEEVLQEGPPDVEGSVLGGLPSEAGTRHGQVNTELTSSISPSRSPKTSPRTRVRRRSVSFTVEPAESAEVVEPAEVTALAVIAGLAKLTEVAVLAEVVEPGELVEPSEVVKQESNSDKETSDDDDF